MKQKLSFWQSQTFQICFLVISITLLYARIIGYNFVYFDDVNLILDNYNFIHKLSNVPKAFAQDVFKGNIGLNSRSIYYRPILTLSFMFDSLFSQKSPWFYHVSNLLFHITACIILLLFLKKLKVESTLSFLLTLIFAFHPILNQAVAWIPGRNDSLLTIFALSSFIFLFKHLESSKVGDLLFHLLFFALALFTKENALVLIILTFIFLFISLKDTALLKKTAAKLTIGYFTIVLIWFLFRSASIIKLSLLYSLTNCINDFPLLLQLIAKTVIPYNLSVVSTIKDTNYVLASIVLLLFLFAIFFRKKGSLPIMLFGFLWFFIFLIPSLFVHTIFGGLEHRVYLPMIGLLIVISNIDYISGTKLKEKILYPILISVIVLFFGLSSARLHIFSNNNEFWQSAVETSKYSACCYLNLGKNYEEAGDYKNALENYTKGIELDTMLSLLYNNQGAAYLYLGKLQEAETALRKEIKHFPHEADPYINLGEKFKVEGKFDSAEAYWQKAIAISPDSSKIAFEELCEYYRLTKNEQKFRYYNDLMNAHCGEVK